VAGNLVFDCLETQSYAYIHIGNEKHFIWCFHWGLDQVFKVMAANKKSHRPIPEELLVVSS
jgi:hypothetical protein